MDGAINFLKPPGMTSSDAVVWLRWVLRQKKIGHGGTLDPAAAGVLPVLVGSGTKLFDRMLNHEKTYAATIRFGCATDTLDAEGTVTETTDAIPTAEDLLRVIPGFVGEIEQIPPAYSAVRVNGQHAYAAARKGNDVELPARRVHIFSISDPVFFDEKTATVRVTCSAGTYIRTLADDIARAAGSLGHLCALTREKSGPFSIDSAWTVAELLELREKNAIETCVTPIEDLLLDLPRLTAAPAALVRAKNGAALKIEDISDAPEAFCGAYRLYTPENELLSVAQSASPTLLKPQIML